MTRLKDIGNAPSINDFITAVRKQDLETLVTNNCKNCLLSSIYMYLKRVTNFLNYYYYYHFIFQFDPCIGRDGEVSHYNLNYNRDFRTTLFPGSFSLDLDFRKVCGMSSKILHFPCHHHHQLNYGWTSQPENLWSPPNKPPAIQNTESFPVKAI